MALRPRAATVTTNAHVAAAPSWMFKTALYEVQHHPLLILCRYQVSRRIELPARFDHHKWKRPELYSVRPMARQMLPSTTYGSLCFGGSDVEIFDEYSFRVVLLGGFGWSNRMHRAAAHHSGKGDFDGSGLGAATSAIVGSAVGAPGAGAAIGGAMGGVGVLRSGQRGAERGNSTGPDAVSNRSGAAGN